MHDQGEETARMVVSQKKGLLGIAECKHMLSLISGRPPPIMQPTAANPIIHETPNDLLLRRDGNRVLITVS